jgi:AcrR family transcriptional regulator
LSTCEIDVSPTSSNSGNAAPAPNEDLSAVIEQEQLPAGIEDLAEPLIEHSQRERLLNAMARSCAKKGYGATTIGDVCEGAGVSRATFYEIFKDKEDCFGASMEVALADAMGRIVAVYSPDKPWATMVRDAASAFLDLLASRPSFARMALVEAPSSGDRAFELYASGKRVLQSLLERGRDDPVEEAAIPSSAGRAALSAAESLIVGQILGGNTARLRELLPDIVYITTVPYLGQEEALRQAREAERTAAPADG